MQNEPQVTKQVVKSLPTFRNNIGGQSTMHGLAAGGMEGERGGRRRKEGKERRGDTSASPEFYHDRQSKIDCAELHGQHTRR